MLESADAGDFQHNGIRGDERAGSLAKFFRGSLGHGVDARQDQNNGRTEAAILQCDIDAFSNAIVNCVHHWILPKVNHACSTSE